MFLQYIATNDGSVLYNLKLPPEEEAKVAERLKPTMATRLLFTCSVLRNWLL